MRDIPIDYLYILYNKCAKSLYTKLNTLCRRTTVKTVKNHIDINISIRYNIINVLIQGTYIAIISSLGENIFNIFFLITRISNKIKLENNNIRPLCI